MASVDAVVFGVGGESWGEIRVTARQHRDLKHVLTGALVWLSFSGLSLGTLSSCGIFVSLIWFDIFVFFLSFFLR